jgi:predicted tellurium resistance membrane protein TerC
MFEMWTHPETWISLATLAAMEIVLGVDNIVFLTILAGKLPPAQQPLARRLGLGAALGTRLALLFAISWLMGLTSDLFSVASKGFSGRDLILGVGGLFLIGKATFEIHDKLEAGHESHGTGGGKASFGWTILQIALLDIVFSLDSVITAVGMAKHVEVMVIAMVVAVGVMLVFAGPIGKFVEAHPTVKMLALSFLILIGVMLVAESLDQHIPRGYVYFAMAFSLAVEMLNLRLRRKAEKPVHLHHKYEHDTQAKQTVREQLEFEI